MDNNNREKNGFTYTYSAREQAELKKIREKYAPPAKEEDKMERLRRLDASVTKKATAYSIILGVIGALLTGLGMSLIMTELSVLFGKHQALALAVGTGIGIIGIVLICCAYPVYNGTVKKERKKIAPEILRLTDELMK